MVKQGDIIKVSFDPNSGHEQAGFRQALIISNNEFIKRTKLAVVCPITNTFSGFPLHVPLDGRTSTTGAILCEHIRTLDLNSRKSRYIERVPEDILKLVTDIVAAEIEMI
ncbi:MAG: type II toxin-antitoxin system PemK/MazF family toxin [Clostridiales bacterium]|nr:type II toxin-antitoxin system PemK/MazF family toxin [Clostridiales bacterium]